MVLVYMKSCFFKENRKNNSQSNNSQNIAFSLGCVICKR